MRKDSLQEEALQKAYLIYAERGGFQTMDYTHDPTDYNRGTVMEPENASNIDGRYAESPEYRSHISRMMDINDEVEALERKMKICRERGNFRQLQQCMKDMAKLMQEKESIDAKMAVENLGAAQMALYDSTMNQDDERFSEITDLEQRIANLEARILEFSESVG